MSDINQIDPIFVEMTRLIESKLFDVKKASPSKLIEDFKQIMRDLICEKYPKADLISLEPLVIAFGYLCEKIYIDLGFDLDTVYAEDFNIECDQEIFDALIQQTIVFGNILFNAVKHLAH